MYYKSITTYLCACVLLLCPKFDYDHNPALAEVAKLEV